MFSLASPSSFRLKCFTALVISGFMSVAMAESSTGIRLGTTDFGGKQTSRLGTTSSKPDTSSRRGHHSYGASHGDHHSYGTSGRHHQPRHHKHHGHQPDLGGIQGHPSFGLSTKPRHRHHHDHGYYRPPALYYRSPNVGVQVYTAPQIYSYGYESYAPSGGTVIRDYAPNDEYVSGAGLNPWTALGEYQYHTARYAFEAQIQQHPHAALPRVGLALSTALAGQLDAAAFAMQDALLSDTSDLRFFNADPAIQLILAELLLSYEGDALMTASLHYLNRDYRSADRAVQVAANYCQPCTAVDNLDALISAQL